MIEFCGPDGEGASDEAEVAAGIPGESSATFFPQPAATRESASNPGQTRSRYNCMREAQRPGARVVNGFYVPA